jgi:hypothetical protein
MVPCTLLLGLLLAAPGDSEPSPLLRPGNLDLRLNVGGVGSFTSLEAGATVDLGLLRLGSGTLSLGAEVSVSQCLLSCWVPNLLTEEDDWQRDLYALGRLGYHFRLSNRNYRKVDVHAVLVAGVDEARTWVDAEGYAFEGKGLGPAFGAGVGGKYFLSSRVFIGAEARLRFAFGTYALRVTRGSYVFREDDQRWTRFGVNTLFFAGLRLF